VVFPAPVRAEQPVRFTGVDAEPDPVDRDKLAETPPESAAFEHVHRISTGSE
jgi:hypothetical protein